MSEPVAVPKSLLLRVCHQVEDVSSVMRKLFIVDSPENREDITKRILSAFKVTRLEDVIWASKFHCRLEGKSSFDRVRTFEREEILEKVAEAPSLEQLIVSLGMNPNRSVRGALKGYLKELEIDLPILQRRGRPSTDLRWTNEALSAIAAKHISFRGMLVEMGYKQSGGNHRMLKSSLEKYGIDISHFKGAAWNKGSKGGVNHSTIPLSEVLIERSSYLNNSHLKKRLISECLLVEVCSECGLTHWREKKLSLVLDHINGHHTDNRLENLRLLCPNCNSLQPTFCRGAKGLQIVEES